MSALVMESKDDNGTTWRYFAECPDDTDADRVVGDRDDQF